MSVAKMSSSSSPRKINADDNDDISANQRPSKIFILLVEGNTKEADV